MSNKSHFITIAKTTVVFTHISSQEVNVNVTCKEREIITHMQLGKNYVLTSIPELSNSKHNSIAANEKSA